MIGVITAIALVLGLLVSLGNLCVMIYALSRFLSKPRTDLEERVTTAEVEIKDIKTSLLQGNDKFRKQNDTNEMFISCMLAFIDFEIAYCHHTNYEYSEDLEKAKTILQHYLAKR